METEKRIKHLEKLLEKGSDEKTSILYKGRMRPFPVHEIDLDYLIYNRYNGRIASFVKSRENQSGRELDATDSNDIKIIEKFLWKSNENRNKITEKRIRKDGQIREGIVTKDGVIIDGNRRAMLLKRNKKNLFRAVVLEDTLNEDAKEIMRLETIYQMGEDAKVDYDPIEKYLKCKDLKKFGFENNDIAEMMGESNPSEIEKNFKIMDLMDQYLEELGYSGIYTRLEGTEGLFVNLDQYLEKYTGGSKIVQWDYDEMDVSNLKLTYFDYIRYVYNTPKGKGLEAKECRIIGKTSKKESFFNNEKIWKNFQEEHIKATESIQEPTVEELKKQNPDGDLNELLKSRDAEWAKKVDARFKENMGKSNELLNNINNRSKPLELLTSAKQKLESIDTAVPTFLEDKKVSDVVGEINSITWDFKQLIKKHNQSHSK